MRSVAFIILHACVALAPAEDLAAHQGGSEQSSVADSAGEFLDRAMGASIHRADLDATTLLKTHPGAAHGKSAAIDLYQPMTMTSGRVAPSVSRPYLATPAAMQDTLKTFGVRPTSLENLALTQLAATRGVATKAQVKEVFSSMDAESQAKVVKMSQDVVVRADTLKKEEMAGVTAPFGFWDPLGMSTDIPEGRLSFFREIELKHGRVSMLATLGIIVSEKFHPLFGGDVDFVSAAASHHTQLQVEKFWPAMLLAIGIAELFFPQMPDKAPGDLGFDPLGLKPKDAKKFMEVQNKELNNGRLAMIAAAGIMVQESLTGEPIFR